MSTNEKLTAAADSLWACARLASSKYDRANREDGPGASRKQFDASLRYAAIHYVRQIFAESHLLDGGELRAGAVGYLDDLMSLGKERLP